MVFLQFLVLTVLHLDEAGKKNLAGKDLQLSLAWTKFPTGFLDVSPFGKPNTSVSLFLVLGRRGGGKGVFILCQKWYGY